jgi:hypothetical protein
MLTFDFKSGYQYVDIREEDQEYLGFSWPMDGKETFFVFTVLPFWLGASAFYFYQVISSFDGEVGCARQPSLVVLGRWPCYGTRLQKLCEGSGNGERGFEKGGGVRVPREVCLGADAGANLARCYLLLSNLKVILSITERRSASAEKSLGALAARPRTTLRDRQRVVVNIFSMWVVLGPSVS